MLKKISNIGIGLTLLVFMVSCQQKKLFQTKIISEKERNEQKHLIDEHGAVIRGDRSKKQLSLVFTGDEFSDGGEIIRSTLKKNKILVSFFLTGRFYSNPAFESLIRSLKQDNHYLGAHSDQHLLYVDWENRDSLLVTKKHFVTDLKDNYHKMSRFGIEKDDALYFLPPYEWYNSEISRWTQESGLTLINFTPGTHSAADYTNPEMGERYLPSDSIYDSIIRYEKTDPNGLNGFILLIHIGTDPRRKDKFYNRLDYLIRDLKERGYSFVKITQLLKDS